LPRAHAHQLNVSQKTFLFGAATASTKVTWRGTFLFSPSGAGRSDLSASIFPHPWLKKLPLAVWSLRRPIFGFAFGISWSSRRPIFGFAYGSLCSAVAKFFLMRKAKHQAHEPYQTPTLQLE
jgi:hypothetical protein